MNIDTPGATNGARQLHRLVKGPIGAIITDATELGPLLKQQIA